MSDSIEKSEEIKGKTIKEWFSLVKDDELRKKLLKNLDVDFSTSKNRRRSFVEALDYGFDWDKTKEGHVYWGEVFDSEVELLEQPTKEIKVKNNFKEITNSIADLLEYKNKKYGNSALNPINIFNGKSKVGQRVDDKLSRVQNSTTLAKNDIADLLGYLTLICEENGWYNFDEFKD